MIPAPPESVPLFPAQDRRNARPASATSRATGDGRGVLGGQFLLESKLTIGTPPSQSHKTFKTKQKLAKAQKQNRPIPQWIRLRTGNTIRYDLFHPDSQVVEPEVVLLLDSASDFALTWEPAELEPARSGWKGTTGADIFPTDITPSGDIGARLVSASKLIASSHSGCFTTPKPAWFPYSWVRDTCETATAFDERNDLTRDRLWGGEGDWNGGGRAKGGSDFAGQPRANYLPEYAIRILGSGKME